MGKKNPLRWNCDRDGCFNRKHRPKIEIFADDLPRNIAISDIDGTVEINGHFLFLEWKSGECRDIPMGQEIWAKQKTLQSPRNTYIIIFGDCETMEMTHIQTIKHGRVYGLTECNLEQFHLRLQGWVYKAERDEVAWQSHPPASPE